jgi:pyridoxine/pyridoxamine 5'-phosphate oxidase
MVVATVDENAQPYQRVLLKHYDEKVWCSIPTSAAAKRSRLKKSAHQPAFPMAYAGAPGDGYR